jgi:hypothetical protein
MRAQSERITKPHRTGLLLLTVLIAAVSCEGITKTEETK